MSLPPGRYDACPRLQHILPDGSAVLYRACRILPRAAAIAADRSIVAREGDRIDAIAARALGDPLQAWRIADANLAMNPVDVAAPGTTVMIPLVGLGTDG